jgi:hypothetical protein
MSNCMFIEFYNEKYQGSINFKSYNDKAFITYSVEQNVLHIWELFVRKQYRNGITLFKIIKDIQQIAKDLDCNAVMGYVEKNHHTPEKVIKLLKLLDFNLLHNNINNVTFLKKI